MPTVSSIQVKSVEINKWDSVLLKIIICVFWSGNSFLLWPRPIFLTFRLLVAFIKKDEMGEACGTHGRYERCIENFSRKIGREETTRNT